MKFLCCYILVCLLAGCASKADVVDSSTLNNKVMCGYQGWFTAPGDENKFDCWMHWAIRGGGLSSSNLSFDMYPDLSEFDDEELFPTKMTMNGTNAFLYSGRTYKTINRHVKWMKQYGIHPPTNPAVAKTIIEWFKTNAPPKYRATVLGGVPAFWRTLGRDSRHDKRWNQVYRSFDIISPWTVGRYNNDS